LPGSVTGSADAPTGQEAPVGVGKTPEEEEDPLAAVMRDALAAAAPESSVEASPEPVPESFPETAPDLPGRGTSAAEPVSVASPRESLASGVGAASISEPVSVVPVASQPSAVGGATAEADPPADPVAAPAATPDAASESAGKRSTELADPPASDEPGASPAATTAWIRSRDPQRYTLQLVGSRELASIERFVVRHGLQPPYAVFERTLTGAAWYSLVAGDYADRATAVAAQARLPASLRDSDTWPRSFGSIQASMD
jgi:DamX protein